MPAPRTRSGSFRLRDYIIAAVGNPRLGLATLRHVSRIRSRSVESELRAAQNPGVRGKVANLPVSIDDLVVQLSDRMGVVLLDRSAGSAAIGVADIEFLSALTFLTTRLPDCKMQIGGKAVHFGTPNFKELAIRARLVQLQSFDEKLAPLTISIEQYQHDGRRWISLNNGNRDLRVIYSDVLEKPGLSHAQDFLGAPTTTMISRARPVDVVFTWVNHGDAGWQKLFSETRSAATGSASSDSTSMTRFTSNDELRYSLRAIAKHMPWVNKVHIFTNCAPPTWVRQGIANLAWVQHTDVIPSEHLPVFNSHVIESYLHRIPDLAEHFIYFNDDFLVVRSLEKSHFFTESGHSISMLESYGVVSGTVRVEDPDYLNAARNSAALIKKQFGIAATRLHQHVPYALRKSVLSALEEDYLDQIEAFRSNKFRQQNDLNIPSFLYHHYAFQKEQARHGVCRSILVKSNAVMWKAMLKEAEGAYDIVCINEGGEFEPSRDWRDSIASFMRKKFPKPSPWER